MAFKNEVSSRIKEPYAMPAALWYVRHLTLVRFHSRARCSMARCKSLLYVKISNRLRGV